MNRSKPADSLGEWTLDEFIDSGGNADVWRAHMPTLSGVLKVLKTRRPTAEPYARFCDEVRVWKDELSGLAGVMPLLDYSLPKHPSKTEPAWIAMPEATLIAKALEGSDLTGTVRAIAVIAHTLAMLAERNVHHRDIKPANLYSLDGQWVIGDFGLADFTSKAGVTEMGRVPGPRDYLPQEAFVASASPDPASIDVYCLANTLWVLATAESRPLPGPQQASGIGSIASFFPGQERVYLLDVLVERATSQDAQSRPSMKEMASELEQWVSPPPTGTIPSVTALAARTRKVVGWQVYEEEAAMRRRELAERLLHPLTESMDKAISLCRDAGLSPLRRSGVSASPGAIIFGSLLLPSSLFEGAVEEATKEESFEVGGPLPLRTGLWGGLALRLFDDGTVELAGQYLVGLHGLRQQSVWQRTESERVDTVLAANKADALVNEFLEQLPSAITSFLNLAEGQ